MSELAADFSPCSCVRIGLYKVATGEDISKAENPGTFDLKVCESRDPGPFLIFLPSLSLGNE